VYGCHLFLPRMLAQDRGHILNIASLAAFATAPKMGAYNVSKSGVVALSETLAGELVGTPITVSVACPSFFQTNIGASMKSDDESSNRAGQALVERSKTTAVQVAQRVLSGVRRGEFLHLPQVDSKLLWRAKRWLPSLSMRAIAFGAKLTAR
jgi:short-subunit dehydrogenase